MIRKAEVGSSLGIPVKAIREIPDPVIPDRVILEMPTAEAARLRKMLMNIRNVWYGGGVVDIRDRDRDADLSLIATVLDQVLS